MFNGTGSRARFCRNTWILKSTHKAKFFILYEIFLFPFTPLLLFMLQTQSIIFALSIGQCHIKSRSPICPICHMTVLTPYLSLHKSCEHFEMMHYTWRQSPRQMKLECLILNWNSTGSASGSINAKAPSTNDFSFWHFHLFKRQLLPETISSTPAACFKVVFTDTKSTPHPNCTETPPTDIPQWPQKVKCKRLLLIRHDKTFLAALAALHIYIENGVSITHRLVHSEGSNFLTSTIIETFQAGHLGRHVATTPREKYHSKVRTDKDDRQNRQDRQDRQGTQEQHWNLTFQDTCVGQQ